MFQFAQTIALAAAAGLTSAARPQSDGARSAEPPCRPGDAAGAEPMIWRLFLAVVLLGVVVGGIVGFNLFRDKMIAGYFAGMQPPPVTVSTIEVEPITWQPGHRGHRHRPRRCRASSSRSRPAASSRRSSSTPTTRSKAGQHLAQIDDAHRARRPRRRPGRSSISPRPSSTRAEELRERGVTAINDLDVAQADATNAAGARSQAHRGDEPEEPRGAVRRHHRHPAGRGRRVRRRPARSMRRCRTSTPCGSTSRSPSRRSASSRSAMPVTVSTEVGDTELYRQDHRASSRGSTRTARLVTVRAEVDEPDGRASTPASSCRSASSCRRRTDVDRAAADGAELDPLRRLGLRRAHRGRGRRRASRRSSRSSSRPAGARRASSRSSRASRPATQVVTAGQNRLTGGARGRDRQHRQPRSPATGRAN